MKQLLAGKLVVGFAGVLVLLGINFWVLHGAQDELLQDTARVTHTYQVLREIESDVSLAKDVETGTRGYIIAGQRAFLEPYEAARRKVDVKLEPLYTLVRDNPAQQQRVLELTDLIDRKLAISKRDIALVDAGNATAARRAVARGEGKAAMDAVRAKASEMRSVEETLLRERARTARRAAAYARGSFWVAGLSTLLLLSLVYAFLTRAQSQSEALKEQRDQLAAQRDELAQQRADLASAYAELKRLEEMRDSLTSMLVHDLRTPLTTLLGPLEMLRDDGANEWDADTRREIVDMSVGSARRLLGLVNELLDVAKLEAGELKLRHESLNPQLVLDEAFKHMALASFDGGARIERDLPDQLPLIQADQEILTRVLINLLGNAKKFTPPTGSVTLGAREVTPREVLPSRLQPSASERDKPHYAVNALMFCIRDTGEGIPPEDLDRIFEKFGQVESRRAGRKMSSGLGLTFCKLAVEAHGGLIWVESELGQGSTFYFTIPLRDRLDNGVLLEETT
jgi:signal transduction histidine kinase